MLSHPWWTKSGPFLNTYYLPGVADRLIHPLNASGGRIPVPILHMWKLRFREGERCAWGHTAGEQCCWAPHPGPATLGEKGFEEVMVTLGFSR